MNPSALSPEAPAPWATPRRRPSYRPSAGVVLLVVALHALGLWTLRSLPPREQPPRVIPVALLSTALQAPPPAVAPAEVAPAPQAPTLAQERPRPPSVVAPTPALRSVPADRAQTLSSVAPTPMAEQAAATPTPAEARLPDLAPPPVGSGASGLPAAPAAGSQPPPDTKAAGTGAETRPSLPAQRVEPPSRSGGYLNNPPPPYPPISWRLGEQGEVTVRAYIETDGQASRVELLRSSGFDRLDRAALAAAKDWRYRPGTRAGQPEAMWFNLPVVFKLQ